MRDPKLGQATLVTVAAPFIRDVNTRPHAHFPPLLLRALFVLATSCCTVRIQLIKFFYLAASVAQGSLQVLHSVHNSVYRRDTAAPPPFFDL